MAPKIVSTKIDEQSYVSLSYGVLWAIAGAMFTGLLLLCVGIRQGQQFIDSFADFKRSTLAYEKGALYDREVSNVKLANIADWEHAADERRKISYPQVVNTPSIQAWGQAIREANLDVLHRNQGLLGLIIPPINVTPLANLPEATILPLPPAPRSSSPSDE